MKQTKSFTLLWSLFSVCVLPQVVTGFSSIRNYEMVGVSPSFVKKWRMASSGNDSNGEWISLLPDNDLSVKKRILVEGDGMVPGKGDQVEINYVGTLVGDAPLDWSVENVVDCWLSHQQGLDGLAPAFQEQQIDGKRLMDNSYFTEDFISTTLGETNKIRCKKLAMAARRLAKEQYDDGMEFDSNKDRGPYSFTVGNKKVIAAMELAIPTMKVGETAQIISLSNNAYGPEGLRKSNGDVMVPPFATLCFEVTLLSCQSS